MKTLLYVPDYMSQGVLVGKWCYDISTVLALIFIHLLTGISDKKLQYHHLQWHYCLCDGPLRGVNVG